MRRNKTKMAFALIALSLIFALVFSLAYFTDRAELSVSVTGGTVGISENATDTWAGLLRAGLKPLNNINPGDSRSLAFTVANKGNKAIDVRHTIKLTVVDAAGNAKVLSEGLDINEETLLQFDIFKASDVVTMSNDSGNAGYILKNNAAPVFSTDTVDADSLMGARRSYIKSDGKIVGVEYYFADTVLDGTGDNAEIGYATADHLGVTSLISGTTGDNDINLNDDGTAVTYDYVLIFRDTSLNDFQGCVVYLDLVIEAKQHLNTHSSWEHIETVELALTSSGEDAQNNILDTAPNAETGVLEDVDLAEAYKYNNLPDPSGS